jgi:Asp-tRNA(Asn)/Glu-tRNA(Gln) amidotransferase A subunit family amidase
MHEQLTIKEILERSKRGELDLTAWNQQFIERSKRDTIKAWAYFDEELWLSNLAQALDTNKNEAYTELLGVPVGIKDTFNTAEMPTQMGSPLWKDFTPGNDARVVHNIKYHGGLTAGKTVTAEFAVHAPNETRNPWNTDHSPGTSSSGSAAGVAAGMVPLAIGTQTAGSIVRPASYCGVFGFKPTFGTIPRTGMLKTTDTLDTIGLFATNIDDCRRLFDVMRVKGLDYPFVNNRLENHAFQQVNGAKWKVGIVTDQHAVYDGYSDYAVNAFDDFVVQLQNDPDVELVRPSFGPLFGEAHAFQRTIYHKSLSYYFQKEFENQTLISPVMYDIISEGNTITPAAYQEALQKQTRLSAEISALFDDVDIILTLSTAGHAPEFGTAIDPPDTSLIWTLCGLPVISVPQFSHNGLPFGFQVMTKKYGDYKLMNFLERLAERGLTPAFSRLSAV